ncbi:hypothetical protein H310_05182 [Aphanomyces invadans]|uniref:Uncharacterized protein n=1 Tax=Aphanomyces invadans TaxID=157072 RepID=A0A024UD61_9STRA|nr:hypothetical protein H310_05182 [Aphanomyces invadans]ETW03817.1 hypothetical protein H310_05182 [Aphanomyces invadans]|eukprot:XP_008868046.1 hypothetical protein H310_05182 [Aphanomyces invadans]
MHFTLYQQIGMLWPSWSPRRLKTWMASHRHRRHKHVRSSSTRGRRGAARSSTGCDRMLRSLWHMGELLAHSTRPEGLVQCVEPHASHEREEGTLQSASTKAGQPTSPLSYRCVTWIRMTLCRAQSTASLNCMDDVNRKLRRGWRIGWTRWRPSHASGLGATEGNISLGLSVWWWRRRLLEYSKAVDGVSTSESAHGDGTARRSCAAQSGIIQSGAVAIAQRQLPPSYILVQFWWYVRWIATIPYVILGSGNQSKTAHHVWCPGGSIPRQRMPYCGPLATTPGLWRHH